MKRGTRVIGLYGIPGAGKSTVLQQLHDRIGDDRFLFMEGSSLVAAVAGGDLESFQKLDDAGKKRCRQQATIEAASKAQNLCKSAVVAGHYMFWHNPDTAPEPVWTSKDESTYTHIVYLRVEGQIIADRRVRDDQKSRPMLSAQHLHEWQRQEIQCLREISYRAGILFVVVDHPDRLPELLRDFDTRCEEYNTTRAMQAVSDILKPATTVLETVLVFDGDKTLIEEDSGTMFFERFPSHTDVLRHLFDSSGYSYTSFRQAMLLCEEAADKDEFYTVCNDVASECTIRPEIESILRSVADRTQVVAIMITCGLRFVFEKVLERYGLQGQVRVIGGGRLSDGYAITPELKSDIVRNLQQNRNAIVWAFGDSPLDLPMLQQADEAFIVVDGGNSRSRSMDQALRHAVEVNGLCARQILCPETCLPRLDCSLLPVIMPEEVAILVREQHHIDVVHGTLDPTTLLLSTPMRDTDVSGGPLREVHRRVGWYLAVAYLSRLIGLEEYSVQHVQGHTVAGHRFHDERKTCIVALMRGGEPMAFGVNDALPLAMFLHSKRPEDVTSEQLTGIATVLLVDAVVNTGKSIPDYVHRLKQGRPDLRIIILAGTVQKEAVSGKRTLTKRLRGYTDVSLVAMRLSENKFTGTRSTDTGNRLFNTTHFE